MLQEEINLLMDTFLSRYLLGLDSVFNNQEISLKPIQIIDMTKGNEDENENKD